MQLTFVPPLCEKPVKMVWNPPPLGLALLRSNNVLLFCWKASIIIMATSRSKAPFCIQPKCYNLSHTHIYSFLFLSQSVQTHALPFLWISLDPSWFPLALANSLTMSLEPSKPLKHLKPSYWQPFISFPFGCCSCAIMHSICIPYTPYNLHDLSLWLWSSSPAFQTSSPGTHSLMLRSPPCLDLIIGLTPTVPMMPTGLTRDFPSFCLSHVTYTCYPILSSYPVCVPPSMMCLHASLHVISCLLDP